MHNRRSATADEIAREINRRLRLDIDIPPSCDSCSCVPTRLKDCDANGCNWTVLLIANCSALCMPELQRTIARVQAEYDLI